MAKTKTADDITALVHERAKVASDVDEEWRLLPLGMVAVTLALVDNVRLRDGKVSHLRLTRAERAKLDEDIKSMFPIVKPEAKGLHVVESSVELFSEFLHGKWKSSDER